MSQDDVNDEKAEGTAVPATTPEQAEGAAIAPESEIEQLRKKLAEKEDEARVNHDRFLREWAELENFKKRMLREKAEALRFASEPLIRDLIPVIDNLERALECGEDDGKSVIEGVRMVVKSLLEIFDRHGVKRIEALGQPFDPAHHQAMAQVESTEHEANQVVEQHHTGYLLHDRLLRPALVTVSRRKSQDTVESEPKRD